MSPDRVIYSFVLGWVVLIAVLIALDWLGNPNRGHFRPKGERKPRNRSVRKSQRRRRRLENDAAIRATLRDAYGASSLRLTWSGAQEDRARRVDDSLVVVEGHGDVLDAASHEVAVIDHTAILGDVLPNIDEMPREAPGEGKSTDTQALGWTLGDDPLALTVKGTAPTPATIRSRVWKNLGMTGAWDTENLARLRAGKPPRRTNPITGRVERPTVDVDTGRATWGSEPLDPFAPPT